MWLLPRSSKVPCGRRRSPPTGRRAPGGADLDGPKWTVKGRLTRVTPRRRAAASPSAPVADVGASRRCRSRARPPTARSAQGPAIRRLRDRLRGVGFEAGRTPHPAATRGADVVRGAWGFRCQPSVMAGCPSHSDVEQNGGFSPVDPGRRWCCTFCVLARRAQSCPGRLRCRGYYRSVCGLGPFESPGNGDLSDPPSPADLGAGARGVPGAGGVRMAAPRSCRLRRTRGRCPRHRRPGRSFRCCFG